MTHVRTADEVLTAIQQVKAAAPAFCTNFFPTQKKLLDWVAQRELMSETRDGAAFFFKKDRDLWHFYFCGANVASLRREMANLPVLKTERMVTDLVGSETALAEVMGGLEEAGFRKYSHLQRMACAGGAVAAVAGGEDVPVVFADAPDRKAILELLESSFDHYADQLPAAYEIDAAIAARQIFAIKCDGELAAILFFETQGFTSTIRYWVVARRFQSKRLGASLMRHYLATHSAVRRFVLWVVATNENAVKKYQHYGYAADGLIDHVLANEMIQR